MTHTSPRGRRRIARLAGKFISFPRRGSGGMIGRLQRASASGSRGGDFVRADRRERRGGDGRAWHRVESRDRAASRPRPRTARGSVVSRDESNTGEGNFRPLAGPPSPDGSPRRMSCSPRISPSPPVASSDASSETLARVASRASTDVHPLTPSFYPSFIHPFR